MPLRGLWFNRQQQGLLEPFYPIKVTSGKTEEPRVLSERGPFGERDCQERLTGGI